MLRYIVPAAHPALLLATTYVENVSGHTMLNRGAPLLVRANAGSELALRLREEYRVSRDDAAHRNARFDIELTQYIYSLSVPADTEQILEFHWHPEVEGIAFPHLHARRAKVIHPAFARAHIPTGHVSLADLVYLLIRDFDVPPTIPDWEQLLKSM